jgi:hypothetical protein
MIGLRSFFLFLFPLVLAAAALAAALATGFPLFGGVPLMLSPFMVEKDMVS